MIPSILPAGEQTCPFPLTWANVISHEHGGIFVLMIGVAIGILITLLLVVMCILYTYARRSSNSSVSSLAMAHAQDCRQLLPETIILIRHGESESNADKSKWIEIPDNLIGLSQKGHEQATLAGQRVAQILLQQDNNCNVHLIVSPFERSLQTAAALRSSFEHLIVRTDIESRIREQEMGNLQNNLFQQYRTEQQMVGRFWYRFPTGESGSDVLDRVKSWWYESVLTVNTRIGYEPIQAIVVVSHGLTMRFILMQLFGWSPTTFHSVWNAGNCQIYVLKKDLNKPGPSPYVLDKIHGDVPQSSINVRVELLLQNNKTNNNNSNNNDDETTSTSTSTTTVYKNLTLKDYLKVPPPRTKQLNCIKYMLAEQYPDVINDVNDIVSIMIMPFCTGGGGKIIKGRSSSSSGVVVTEACSNKTLSSSSSTTTTTTTTAASPPPSLFVASSTISSTKGDQISSSSSSSSSLLSGNDISASSKVAANKREQSLRWSYFRIPNER